MDNKKTIMLGGTVIASAILGLGQVEAKTNALRFNTLGSGAEVRANLLNSTSPASALELTCGAKKEGEKTSEHKCGEGKCGEGKCGEKKEASSTTKSESKTAEHKCGEGKCGEGKCGEKKEAAKTKTESKTAEHKCGEGKCGK